MFCAKVRCLESVCGGIVAHMLPAAGIEPHWLGTASHSQCSTVSHATCVRSNHVGVTTLEDCRLLSNFCPNQGSNPRTLAHDAKVLTTGPRVVPYTSWIGAGICHSSTIYYYTAHCGQGFKMTEPPHPHLYQYTKFRSKSSFSLLLTDRILRIFRNL